MKTFPYQVTHADGGEGVSSINSGIAGGTDIETQNSNFQRTYKFGEAETDRISLVEKPIAARIGNTSNVRCEIRYGKKFEYNQVFLNVA